MGLIGIAVWVSGFDILCWCRCLAMASRKFVPFYFFGEDGLGDCLHKSEKKTRNSARYVKRVREPQCPHVQDSPG